MRPFTPPLPAVVGHRGAPRRAPENTPESFAAALTDGATWVELDARRSGDDVVVVHHDPCTPDGVPVCERAAADLAALGVWTLADVLARLDGAAGVDLELKNLPGQPDYDEDERLGWLVADVLRPWAQRQPLLVSSFNPHSVREAVTGLDDVPGGLLGTDALGLPALLDIADEFGFGVLCPHADAPGVDADGVRAAHEAGKAVLVWTVDDPAHAARLAADGVDALCTNDPAGVCAALGR